MNSGFEKLLSAAEKHKGGVRTGVAKESCHREGRAERGMSYSSGVLRQNKRKRDRSVSIKMMGQSMMKLENLEHSVTFSE